MSLLVVLVVCIVPSLVVVVAVGVVAVVVFVGDPDVGWTIELSLDIPEGDPADFSLVFEVRVHTPENTFFFFFCIAHFYHSLLTFLAGPVAVSLQGSVHPMPPPPPSSRLLYFFLIALGWFTTPTFSSQTFVGVLLGSRARASSGSALPSMVDFDRISHALTQRAFPPPPPPPQKLLGK